MITALFDLIVGAISPTHLALDGHFDHNYALQMARQMGLHLVSKLRHDSALYFPYQGPIRKRKYGQKLNPRKIPEQFLCERTSDKGMQTEIYQTQVRHKEFAQLLNVVIIVKTNLKTQAQAHVILLSSDLDLSYQTVIDYTIGSFANPANSSKAPAFSMGLKDGFYLFWGKLTTVVKRFNGIGEGMTAVGAQISLTPFTGRAMRIRFGLIPKWAIHGRFP